jgi:elongation factor 1-alpha
VTTIELHHVSRVIGSPGDLIGFKVRNVRPADLHRGMVAVTPDKPLVPVNHFLVQVIIINHPNEVHPGFVAYCYCHTATFPAKWVAFRSKQDRRTGRTLEESPKRLKQGKWRRGRGR